MSEGREHTTGADLLDDLLSQAGVDLGRPEKRRARAVRLQNEGCGPEALEELVKWAHTTRRKLHTVGTWLAWATRDKATWEAVLADVRKLKASREDVAPNQTAQRREPTAEENHRWLCGMAWARVHADHRAEDEVATELGVDAQRLRELIAEEQARRVVPCRNEPPATCAADTNRKPRRMQLVKTETEDDETW